MAISLSNIARGARSLPPKIAVCGVAGIGKSSFGAYAPSPVFLCLDDTLGSLSPPRVEPRPGDPVIASWSELLECVEMLARDEHDFSTLVIDPIDLAQPLLYAHLCRLHGQPDIEGAAEKGSPFAFGRGVRVYALPLLRELLGALDWLRTNRGMAIVLTAHATVVRYNDPRSEGYDRYQPAMDRLLGQAVCDWVDDWLFFSWRVATREEKLGFGKTRARGVSSGQRVLYTQERPAYWAKNHHGLPAEIAVPEGEGAAWAAYASALAEGMARAAPASTDTMPERDVPTPAEQPETAAAAAAGE
jgi:hypothetical protein